MWNRVSPAGASPGLLLHLRRSRFSTVVGKASGEKAKEFCKSDSRWHKQREPVVDDRQLEGNWRPELYSAIANFAAHASG